MDLRRRRIALGAGGGAAAVAAVLGLAAPGGVQIAPASARARPAWSTACFTRAPREDRLLLARCVRLSGRVLWAQRSSFTEAHLLVSAGLRPVLVKIDHARPHGVPAIGHRIVAVGPLLRSRSGLREVEEFELD